MTRDELRAMLAEKVEEHTQTGGKVHTIPQGVRLVDTFLSGCKCGCAGDYTDHTMRLGERGVYGGY